MRHPFRFGCQTSETSGTILCVRIKFEYFSPKRLHCLMHSGTVLHLGLYHVLSCFRLSFSFRSRNFLVVMNLDGCDRLFSLHLFRTLPVGYILGCLLVCVLSIFFLLFLFDSESLPPIIFHQINFDSE